MNRRDFLRLLAAAGGGAATTTVFARERPPAATNGIALPPVLPHAFSPEAVMNTRLSYHGGFSSDLADQDQILSNVLWAASRAPLLGTARTLYAATQDNVYLYDPDHHELSLHLAGNHLSGSGFAFEVGVVSDLSEDAGSAIQYALLAAAAFWTDSADQPGFCPMESAKTNADASWGVAGAFQMINCYGRRNVTGILTDMVAVSSDESLPDPATDSSAILETKLARLDYGDRFHPGELSLSQFSQFAWASYGNTPHRTDGNFGGLTVPSSRRSYYLSARVYLVRSEGVECYHERLPGGDKTTRDHRIGRVTDGDRRPALRAAVPRIPPTAPGYLVYCSWNDSRQALLEAGFAGADALLQATSLGLRGHMTGAFSSAERAAIAAALDIPAADVPLVVFSAGQPEGADRLSIDRKIKAVKNGTTTEQEAKDLIQEYMQ